MGQPIKTRLVDAGFNAQEEVHSFGPVHAGSGHRTVAGKHYPELKIKPNICGGYRVRLSYMKEAWDFQRTSKCNIEWFW